jgi:hypothetical protein
VHKGDRIFFKKQVNHLRYFFLGLFFCLRCPCKAIAFHRQTKDLYALDKQGEVYVLTMWREGVKEGDRIVLDEGEFLVRWVEYYLDPPDMFIAEIELV